MNNRHGKNNRVQRLALLILPILAILAGTTVHATGLRFIYTNDNLGELDGCG